MVALSTTQASAEQPAMLLIALQLTTIQAGETAANGCARAALDAALARLRWACETAAIEAEGIVTQAEEALSLG
jgi:hypothetical protein